MRDVIGTSREYIKQTEVLVGTITMTQFVSEDPKTTSTISLCHEGGVCKGSTSFSAKCACPIHYLKIFGNDFKQKIKKNVKCYMY